MRIALYVIWFLLPSVLLLSALWAKLESFQKPAQKAASKDLVRQGLFVLVCCVVAVAIDQYVLEAVVTALLPEFIPLGFFQILLLPVVLLLGAKLVGPTKTTVSVNRKLSDKRTTRGLR